MAHCHCHGILVIPVSALFASVLENKWMGWDGRYYSKLTTTSTFSVLILLIAETDNSSRFFLVLFFSLFISLFTSFAISRSSPQDEVDEMEDSDEASSFPEGMMDEGIIENFTRSRKIEYKDSALRRNLKNVSIEE